MGWGGGRGQRENSNDNENSIVLLVNKTLKKKRI